MPPLRRLTRRRTSQQSTSPQPEETTLAPELTMLRQPPLRKRIGLDTSEKLQPDGNSSKYYNYNLMMRNNSKYSENLIMKTNIQIKASNKKKMTILMVII